MTLRNKKTSNQILVELEGNHSNLTLEPLEIKISQAERFNAQSAAMTSSDLIKLSHQDWAQEAIAARARAVDSYTSNMSISPARRSLDSILGEFIAQDLLLPDLEVVTRSAREFKVDAQMPESRYNSDQASRVRRRFYALYQETGIFVDLRLQPKKDV